MVSVDSIGLTWDAITFKYLSDVQFIDQALAHVFARCSVDPTRVVVEGFSDGATYALGLGLANGDLFRRVVAFSPGGIVPSDSPATGRPEFFISHGLQDPILPIDLASRQIVEDLRDDGYTVEYNEFNGGHEIPAPIASLAAGPLAEGPYSTTTEVRQVPSLCRCSVTARTSPAAMGIAPVPATTLVVPGVTKRTIRVPGSK